MNSKFSKSRLDFLISTVVISASVSFFAAMLATVITNSSLDEYMSTLALTNQSTIRLSEQKPRPIPGTFEEALRQVRNNAAASVGYIYPRQKAGTAYAPPIMPLGSAVSITSDGWLLTSSQAVDGYAPPGLSVVIDSEVYSVVQKVGDSATNAVLLKIEAQTLQVVNFGAPLEVANGDLAFVVRGAGEIDPTSVMQVREWIVDSPYIATEKFPTAFRLSDEYSRKAFGAAVLNSAGELVGIVSAKSDESQTDIVLPIHHALGAINSVLRSGEVSRPYFGAVVADANLTAGLDRSALYDRKYGALVQSVRRGSPAQLAGLQAGDLIVSIGQEPVNGTIILQELIASYSSGDKIDIAYLRAGKEEKTTVELTDIKQ
ncbi:MAG: Peptidase S1C, Do [uncultured bacterium]|nr:MAG: Peptidase S1C, Do [uncultured bacterium]HBD04941.1 hypothetical protein [Candidatus Uhrbacteria bacterium]